MGETLKNFFSFPLKYFHSAVSKFPTFPNCTTKIRDAMNSFHWMKNGR